jgi:hypothetical protein
MLSRGFAFVLLTSSALLALSCEGDSSCTLIGCGPPLEVVFTGATTEAGHYEIDAVTDQGLQRCEGTIPFSCDVQPACPSPVFQWTLTRTGCDNDGGPQSIGGFVFHTSAPTTLELTVRRDQRIVGTASAEPEYQETRPNGPDCEPACRKASNIEVELTP